MKFATILMFGIVMYAVFCMQQPTFASAKLTPVQRLDLLVAGMLVGDSQKVDRALAQANVENLKQLILKNPTRKQRFKNAYARVLKNEEAEFYGQRKGGSYGKIATNLSELGADFLDDMSTGVELKSYGRHY